MNATSSSAKSEALDMLRKFLRPGSTVYTVLRSVARSGMSRVIDLYTFDDGRKVYLTGYVSKVLGMTRTDDGIRVNGCGSDAGFDTVYALARTMFRDGFDCCGKSCQSNDHSNLWHDKAEGRIPAGTCCDHLNRTEGECKDLSCKPWHHRDGGYAFRHEWI